MEHKFYIRRVLYTEVEVSAATKESALAEAMSIAENYLGTPSDEATVYDKNNDALQEYWGGQWHNA